MGFAVKTVTRWDNFVKQMDSFERPDRWIYRGHTEDYPLKTTLERAREYFDIEWSDLPGIEEQLIRNFRRRFQDEGNEELHSDKMYCISLMQHHGAPTRLLDFTWSVYVGAFFALENSNNPPYEDQQDMPVLWCINAEWVESNVGRKVNGKLLGMRRCDKKRNDKTFVPMYMGTKRTKFVDLETPLRLNARLVIQQGTFLCLGDVSCSFEDNLKNYDGWNSRKNILKIFFDFSKEERKRGLHQLNRMNINQASLFPGLDGYARSMKQLIPIFESMARNKAGKGGRYGVYEKNCI